jgi:hypothetical protein
MSLNVQISSILICFALMLISLAWLNVFYFRMVAKLRKGGKPVRLYFQSPLRTALVLNTYSEHFGRDVVYNGYRISAMFLYLFLAMTGFFLIFGQSI